MTIPLLGHETICGGLHLNVARPGTRNLDADAIVEPRISQSGRVSVAEEYPTCQGEAPVQVSELIDPAVVAAELVAELVESPCEPGRVVLVRGAAEGVGLEAPGLEVGGDADAVVDHRVEVRLLLVLGERLDADDDREADDDDAQNEEEELLLSHGVVLVVRRFIASETRFGPKRPDQRREVGTELDRQDLIFIINLIVDMSIANFIKLDNPRRNSFYALNSVRQ